MQDLSFGYLKLMLTHKNFFKNTTGSFTIFSNFHIFPTWKIWFQYIKKDFCERKTQIFQISIICYNYWSHEDLQI